MYLITPTNSYYAAAACTLVALFAVLFMVILRNRRRAKQTQLRYQRTTLRSTARAASKAPTTTSLRQNRNDNLPSKFDKNYNSLNLQHAPVWNDLQSDLEVPDPVIPDPADIEEPNGLPVLPPSFEALLFPSDSGESADGTTERPLQIFSEIDDVTQLSPLAGENGAGATNPEESEFTWDAIMAPFLEKFLNEIAPEEAQSEPIPKAETNAEAEAKAAELPEPSAPEEAPAPSFLSFYGLRQQPFDVTPDPAYFFLSAMHREALTAISLGVENLRGFMTLIAEPGMGKTTVLHKMMEALRDSARVVFLFQTQCSSDELLRYVLNELEIEYTGMDIVAMHRALNQALFEEMLQGRRFVLIVDEAQNLQDSVLETIRLLSDYETTHSKLIQIVLAGQPQLAETLMRPNLAQLRQRIAVLANLEALGESEISEYIEHRLRTAGWSSRPMFTPDAVTLIAKTSEGIPRRINHLCFNAMLEAYLQRREIIDCEIVKKVASRLDLEQFNRRAHGDVADDLPGAPTEPIGFTKLARTPANPVNAYGRHASEPGTGHKPKAKTCVTVMGNLTDKARSQSWSKKREFRIEASFERDPDPGTPVADRYYCCNFYVSEEQATNLRAGEPIRVKFEQD